MHIWDLHTHLTAPGETPVESAETLLRRADHMGIERVCMYMGLPGQVAGEPADVYRDRTPSPEDFRVQNDQILEAVEEFPDRIFGFVYLNPTHVEESLAELNRCVAEGSMVAIKLWTAIKASDPKLDPIVERAAELNAPIFQHTWLKVGGDPPRIGGGNLPHESTPQDLVALAERHPEHPFVMGHAGGDWELGVRAARGHDNVWLGIAGGYSWQGEVALAIEELGADRVIYGSDAGGRSFSAQMAKVYGAPISDEEKQLIFRDNLRGLLQPILDDKGIEV